MEKGQIVTKTWGEIYHKWLSKGYDPGYAAWLADRYVKHKLIEELLEYPLDAQVSVFCLRDDGTWGLDVPATVGHSDHVVIAAEADVPGWVNRWLQRQGS